MRTVYLRETSKNANFVLLCAQLPFLAACTITNTSDGKMAITVEESNAQRIVQNAPRYGYKVVRK